MGFSSRVQAPCGSSLCTDPWMKGTDPPHADPETRARRIKKIQREPRSIEIGQAFSKPRAKMKPPA
jgi:hypothetical protein